MSSILDSLKKSQQQRPDESHRPASHWRFGANAHTPGRRGGSNWRLVFGGLVLLTLLVWGFGEDLASMWNRKSQAEPTTPAPVWQKQKETPARTPLTPTGVTAGQAHKQPQPRTSAQTETPKTPAQTTLPRPDPNKTRAALLALNQTENSDNTLPAGVLMEEKARLASQQQATIEMPSQPDVRASKSAARSAKPPSADQSTANAPDRNVATKQTPDKTMVRPATDRTTAEHPHDPAVKRQKYRYLYQLPFSIRKQLPALTLNIHVYDDDPAHRLVVINGLDLGIGDPIEGTEVVVKDILPEGALLEADGEAFLLPNHR